MERIVECSCGHGAGEHNEYGCFARNGSHPQRCGCLRSTADVIEVAVEEVRTHYLRLYQTEDAS